MVARHYNAGDADWLAGDYATVVWEKGLEAMRPTTPAE